MSHSRLPTCPARHPDEPGERLPGTQGPRRSLAAPARRERDMGPKRLVPVWKH